MVRLLITFAFVIACAYAGVLPETDEFPFGRIVNGEDTTIEKHPYQVSIQTLTNSHFCGGSIINSDTIVTAAHCMQRYTSSEFQIRLGSTYRNKGGEVVAVRAFRNHELYDKDTQSYDVSVIKLATPVRQSSRVRYIDLARRTPKTGTEAMVTGWGTKCFLLCSSPDQLMEVDVDIVDRKSCANDYKYSSEDISDTMVCAWGENKDACQGDSGGPLVAENKLVGIVSWGNLCARAGYPGVYSDVPSLRDWILKTAGEL